MQLEGSMSNLLAASRNLDEHNHKNQITSTTYINMHYKQKEIQNEQVQNKKYMLLRLTFQEMASPFSLRHYQ